MTYIDDIPHLMPFGPTVMVQGCTAQVERDGQWVQCKLPGGHQGNHVYDPVDLYLAVKKLAESIHTTVHKVFDALGLSAATADAIVLAARTEGIQ